MRGLLVAEGPTRARETAPAWRPRSALAKGLLAGAAACSLVAAYAHLQVAPDHFGEWWGYGAFMVIAAAAQLALAAMLLVLARGRERALPRAIRGEPLTLAAGIAGNAALVALYFWTRVVGDPVGPMAGMKEEVEPIDHVAKTAELLLLALLGILMLMRGRRRRV